MPSRCLTMTSPVVTRLLMRSPSSTRFCSRKVRSWVAATPPVSMRLAQVRVGAGQHAAERLELRGEVPDRRLGVDLAVQDGVAVPDQRRGDVEVVVGGVDERVAAVDDRLEVLAGAGEGGAELVDGGLEVVLVDRLDGLGQVGQQGVGGDRETGVLLLDHRAVVEVGAVVALRLELDVLLTDRGPVADHGEGVGGDLVVAVVDVEHDVDALVGEHELVHLADADAAVGDLAARRRCRRSRRSSR